MSSSFETCTKEKVISYEQKRFVKTSLRVLGVNTKQNGFIILQKSISYAYENDMIIINVNQICKHIALITKLPLKTIESSIRYTFNNINIKKFSNNYENIFDLEFSSESFNLGNLISDFKDIFEEMESI